MRLEKQIQPSLFPAAFFIGLLLIGAVELPAQSASRTHVFPQIADGRMADGSFFTSTLWVMNLSGSPATCTLSLYGVPTSRFAETSFQNIPNGGWIMASTRGLLPIATGYGRINCSQAVTANLFYTLTTADNAVAGMATVFSSPAVTYAAIPVSLSSPLRYGIALANDTDNVANLNLLFTTSEGQITGRNIQISPRSQYVRFIDEIVSLPGQGAGTFEILAQSGRFSVVGLLFNGAVFTTLVPATSSQ